MPAAAVMDIANNGAVLDAGRFAMRITNVGVIGNAFFNKGLSSDPSFEYPRGSGHECLEHAELWVGATRADGSVRVSGGPMLEWRPTLDPSDTVRVANAGDPGMRTYFDDDGDGRVDEAFLGSAPGCAAASCAAIQQSGSAFGSGDYYLSSDLSTPQTCTF